MLETICEVLEDAYKRNWITSRDGNVSIRHHDRDHFYITPSGVRKQTMQPDQFKKIIIKPPLTWNELGTGLLAERWGWKEDQYTDISANLKPSGEIPLHFGLQKQMGQDILLGFLHSFPLNIHSFVAKINGYRINPTINHLLHLSFLKKE